MKRILILSCIVASVVSGCDMDSQGGQVHELEVAPSSFVFDEDSPENNTFTVISNVRWRVTSIERSVELDIYEGGAGETAVTVANMPAGQTAIIKVTTLKNDISETAVSKEVTVTRGTGGGGEEPDEPAKIYPWAELPKTMTNGNYEYISDGGKVGDFKYVTHHATTYRSKKYVRNYSACYDTRRHNPMWVAYPFHAIYEEGGWTRPEPDPWRRDPKFSENEQSIIYPIDWQNHPNYTDTRRWSKMYGMNAFFSRGHLLMSANRGAGSKTTLLDLNTQTFYPTNISPEYHKYPEHWKLVEERLTKWNCPDTVYVVTGCYYATDNNVIKDASWSGSMQSYSKDCVVPTAHYKVFLRTKSGNTKKPIQECSADELMTIGFWFEQKLDSKPFAEQPALSTIIMSVSDIEKRIGNQFRFFPDVPQQIKEGYRIDDWPGLADISTATYPPHNSEK